MSRSLTVSVDPAAVLPSKAIATAARMAPLLLIITGRAFNELTDELGSFDAAMRHLVRVSENVGKPIGCNFPTPEGSRTVFLAPRSWSQTRLRGWIAGHHELIEGAFGTATPVPLEADL